MRAHRTVTPIRRPRRQATSILSVSAGAMLAASWASGCSVIYDLDTKQCDSTADCQALGGVFADLQCIENLCQLPDGSCETNEACLNRDNNTGAPMACIPVRADSTVKECVQLTTTECPLVLPVDSWYENLLLENNIILAGTSSITGATLEDQSRNYELAMQDVVDTVGGIGSNFSHPVVMVTCKAAVDATELQSEIEHLVGRLKVPGIVSAWSAQDLQTAFNLSQQDEYAGVQPFFMSAQPSDPLLETFADDGRIWSVYPGADIMARAYAPLLTRTLAHLGLTSDVRVALITASNERFLANMKSTITATPANYGISFNGAGVGGNDATHYLAIDSDIGDDLPPSAIDRLLEFKPHVVISAAGDEFIRSVMAGLESGWDAAAGGQARPFYILSPYQYTRSAVVAAFQGNASLRTRVVGVNGAGAEDPTVYEKYVQHWDATFSDSPNGHVNENFFDAVYYTLYAAHAAGEGLKNGVQMAAGMQRLLSGDTFDVGPDDMQEAMTRLQTPSARITLQGTLGAPGFSLVTGNREIGSGSVWCIDNANQFLPDVLRYQDTDDPTTGGLSGDFPPSCISNF